MSKWQTKNQLIDLLCDLVAIPSVTGTEAEIVFPKYVHQQLNSLSYFQQHPDHLRLYPTGDGREFLIAMVKSKRDIQKAVILVSHFDVVDVEDYGLWKESAFDAKHLTQMFYDEKESLPEDIQNEMNASEMLFGRGTMDMKCGLAIHMSMIEQAIEGKFDGNLILLTVPDEEVNSVGMRAAVPALLELAQTYQLEYKAVLNSESMFTRFPGDQNKYIYTGTIGKVLPGFLCYGDETHVGEPFLGLNANFMASQLTCELELNTDFCEVVEGEASPPPTNLIQKGLKRDYSVKIPHRAVTLFNLFILEKKMDEIVHSLLESAQKVAVDIKRNYEKHAKSYVQYEPYTPQTVEIRTLTYQDLLYYAVEHHGLEQVQQIEKRVMNQKDQENDERELTIELVDQLAILCKELAPMIVLFFAPPYYPAICSRDNSLIKQVTSEMITYAREKHDISLQKINYFGGISDLSYVGLQYPINSIQSFVNNMPLWEKGYSVPLKELEQFNVPVINLGSVGKDAHQRTERLNVTYTVEILTDLLPTCIRKLLADA
ncbi:M20/M25/M40 family metallo-hydrolase [Shimazuella sp. AN120528]|uniref:M20/M25/M40 family metallo-hydrolase n=1 Tax=Shimazuella soli TaxID=1892854 RepID=UPI001F10D9C9|nr:M20/M25/M40 family metallo-hydrolase [Shimazuella soli]MCH5585456.1 M20/M25/M40 family metallo-hydrolase [Shimazuella soli]